MTRVRNYLLIAFAIFIVQYFLGNLLAIRQVRPDFFLVLILYFSVWEGRFWGIITGFVIGLLVDLIGVGSYFGLTSLSYVIFAYLAGILQGKFSRWPPIFFHISWSGLVILHSFVEAIIGQQDILLNNPTVYWSNIIFSSLYGIALVLIANLILPLGKTD